MKTVIIACGAGIATSTLICDRVKHLLSENGIAADIIQCTVADIAGHAARADLIITSMKLENRYEKPIVTAISFLTGIGREQTEQEILGHLK
ncbi:PTS sugar transporter subunit IIB [Brevibacillus nitrificans]|uniref:PTS sugar transporter subunit IIB n=1 Tax=Brevibacillus nitrificans TaxID=651560 RepID=UPI002E2446C4|nr:PTS sugar transporter subunit IIB [Brevibacillus nitrificans]